MSTGQVYLDAVLEPPRSLSPSGFRRVMLALGGASLLLGIMFLSQGAYPVTGFLGLEILVVWAVFRRSFQAQTARTYAVSYTHLTLPTNREV